MAENGLLHFIATMLGLRTLIHRMLGRAIETDLTIASAVMQAQTLQEAEQYCRKLDSSGQTELAAEIRRQLAALQSPTLKVGIAQAEQGNPPELPSPTQKELPPPEPERRRPGRPRKFRPEPPDPPANGQPNATL